MDAAPRYDLRRLLIECGEALYGPRWQTDLAADLGVSDRTVRRWVAGTSGIPVGVCTDLLRIVRDRAARLDALASKIHLAHIGSGAPPPRAAVNTSDVEGVDMGNHVRTSK